MTHAGPDITARFTPEADARFTEYLDNARAALAGCDELSPDEVEQDIRAHVAAEFPPGCGWVRLDQLEPVLARLGRPEQWVSDGGPSPWRRSVNWVRARPAAVRRRVRDVATQFRSGPDDWRLAYLTFGTFLAAVVVFPLAVVILPISYILGRAALSMARERGTPLGSQRWLVYPPLLLVSVPLLLGLVVWPIGPAVGITEEVWRHNRGDIQAALDLPRGLCELLTGLYFIVGATSLWNLLVGVTFWLFPRLPAAVFSPLFAAADGKVGRRLTLVAGATFGLWLGFTLRTLPVGDWVRDALRPDGEPGRPMRVSRPTRDAGAPRGDVAEEQARRAATDFLRACRHRNVDEAVSLAATPFYTGATGGNLLVDAEPVLHDRSRLHGFLEAQLRQVQKSAPLPNETIRVLSYEAYRTLEADAATAEALDAVLTPDDFVVGVGRDGQETGRVFVRLHDGEAKVVGMAK